MKESLDGDLKERILAAIQRLAVEQGIHRGDQGPGRGTFIDATGFSEYDLTRCGWVNWSEAMIAAGYKPNTLQVPIPLDALLERLADLARELGRLPTNNHIRVATKRAAGFPSLTTFSARLGSQENRYRLLAEWCRERAGYGDVAELLSAANPTSRPVLDMIDSPAVDLPEYEFSDSFLPPIVALLPILATGSRAVAESCRLQNRSLNSEFERRVGVAFSILGFQLEKLGQGKGAVADGIAKCIERQWAVIYDAKVRGSGYRLLTDDRRKFRDYISTHERTLSSEGIRRLYFAVVSSEFSERDLARARDVKSGTDARSCALMEASALVALVEKKIREPLRNRIDDLERLFEETRIIAEADVERQ